MLGLPPQQLAHLCLKPGEEVPYAARGPVVLERIGTGPGPGPLAAVDAGPQRAPSRRQAAPSARYLLQRRPAERSRSPLRRAVPLCGAITNRSPATRNPPQGNRGRTYGLSSWIPFFGQGVYFNPRQFVYPVRSYMCPAFAVLARESQLKAMLSAPSAGRFPVRDNGPTDRFGRRRPNVRRRRSSCAVNTWPIRWGSTWPGRG